MKAPDLLCVAFIGLALLLGHFVQWPAFLRRSRVDPGRARLWIYSGLTAGLWALVAAVAGLWLSLGRSWKSLRLIEPRGWQLWASVGLILALGIMLARSAARIARLRRQKRIKVPSHAESFAPRTRSELHRWVALSFTAGFSEELIFRGYLIWAFQPLLGLWGAAAFSVAVFAAGHSYEGGQGMLATGMVATALTLVVLILGSLWPAIVMHVLTDLEQGLVSWLVLREAPEGGAPAALPGPGTPATPGQAGSTDRCPSPEASPRRTPPR